MFWSEFQCFQQQLMVKSVIIDSDDLIKHVTSNDSLCVIGKLEIKNLEEKTVRHVNATRFVQRHISNKYGNVLNDPTFSDFKFIVRDKEFNTHKAILASSSNVMRKMFTSDLLESKQGQCTVHDIEPEIFDHMLRFIYTGQLPQSFDGIAVDLLKASHFYGIDDLVQICKEHIHFKVNADNAVEIYAFASVYELNELKLDVWNIVKR